MVYIIALKLRRSDRLYIVYFLAHRFPSLCPRVPTVHISVFPAPNTHHTTSQLMNTPCRAEVGALEKKEKMCRTKVENLWSVLTS